MESEDRKTLVVPEVRVYDARRDEDVILTNVAVDADYVRDRDGRAMYFDVDEGRAHLAEQGKTTLGKDLVELYVAVLGDPNVLGRWNPLHQDSVRFI